MLTCHKHCTNMSYVWIIYGIFMVQKWHIWGFYVPTQKSGTAGYITKVISFFPYALFCLFSLYGLFLYDYCILHNKCFITYTFRLIFCRPFFIQQWLLPILCTEASMILYGIARKQCYFADIRVVCHSSTQL